MHVSHDNGKFTENEMSKLFLCDYDHCDMVKCHRNVNFEEIGTDMMDFDYCEEHLRSLPNELLLW